MSVIFISFYVLPCEDSKGTVARPWLASTLTSLTSEIQGVCKKMFPFFIN